MKQLQFNAALLRMTTCTLFLVSCSLAPLSAQIISTIAGNGTSGYDDAGPATLGMIAAVSHVSVDNAGNLYFPDYYSLDDAYRVRKVSASGIIGTIAGSGTAGYSGDGGNAAIAQFRTISAVRPDNLGNLYVVDQMNHVIRKIDAAHIITTVAGNGNGAGTTIGGYSGDGGPATVAELSQPVDVAIDNIGNLFISDGMNDVIRKVTPAGIISTIAGIGTEGYTGDGGQATAAKINPYGLAVDAGGNIYFVQAAGSITLAGHAIRKISPSGIITTICGTGAEGYSGDGGPATAATMRQPSHLAFDAAGNLYVSDMFNYVVRKINTSGIITTVAGCGIPGFSGNGGPATSAKMDFPASVAVDIAGNLYIPDRQNFVIRKVTAAAANVQEISSKQIFISLFPNPNNGRFLVTGRGIASDKTILQMRIVTMFGQIIYSDGLCTNNAAFRKEIVLDKELPSGLYMLMIGDEIAPFSIIR